MKKPIVFAAFILIIGVQSMSAQEAKPAPTYQIPDSYREQVKSLRPQIDANIEKYRKGDAAIIVRGADGKALADAKVRVLQKTHDFKFGCNILVLGQMGEKNAAYEDAFVRLFNLATTTFCCRIYNPEKGKFLFAEGEQDVWRRPQPDRVLAFCQKHGLTMKGQPVIAGSWHPSWMSKDLDECKKEYLEYMKAVAAKYGETVPIFDLVNESQCHKKPAFSLYEPSLEYVGWAFREAKKLLPKKTVLEINEATGYAHDTNVYLKQIKGLLDDGAEIDSIGFQFHFFSKPETARHLAGKWLAFQNLPKIYDKYCELGLPLYITEITVPSTMGQSLEEGEAIQAEITENLYRLWFSVPNMAGIINWNLCDGAAWGGASGEGKTLAGLIDSEMREKPAYQALYQLIKREWNTQLEGQTNVDGKFDFRGFYGKYDIDVVVGDKTQRFQVDLTKDAKPFELKLNQ